MSEDKDRRFRVFADCCTSGNCIMCQHLPYGSKDRRPILGDTKLTRKGAERIALSWKAYNPEIVEVK